MYDNPQTFLNVQSVSKVDELILTLILRYECSKKKVISDKATNAIIKINSKLG